MQNYLTTGTKSDKILNFINYLGLEMKTVLTSGTKSDKSWNLSLTSLFLKRSRDQNWQFTNLFITKSNFKFELLIVTNYRD